ncbi:MAG: NADP-dependent malic enzyme [Pseudobdellovibrionaceae bacterium]
MSLDKEALEYHAKGKPGKLEISSSKPCHTERDLSLAYSPGVAAPCKEIFKDPSKVYDYTTKGNMVAVITDGTAVLGLGNIGPLAAKPVMEGKGVLFKQFAGIDSIDLEMKTKTVDEFVAAVSALEPTFGGINLEDIKAPECFEVEERLKKIMNIPVFHDDQHGTAIISGAALLNACHVTHRKLENIKLVVNGAGASAIACSNIFISLGVKRENLTMCDSSGVIYKGRDHGMNKYKAAFANETKARTLKEALEGADVFVGLSVAGAVTPDMLKNMAKNPILFAMANPDPEITPPAARAIRPDAIVATGRSDYPNQVNNVLGFPSIFRGALDVRATQINEQMKLAAIHALAALAREDVHERVSAAYGGKIFQFGPDYIIPKPFDPRVLMWVAPAVAKAAMDSGVAQKHIEDFDKYKESLEAFQGPSKVFIRSAINRVRANTLADGGKPPKIVFPEGNSIKILRALKSLVEENICEPILLGYPDKIHEEMDRLNLPMLKNIQIVHPSQDSRFDTYAKELFEKRARRGVTMKEAERLMADPQYFASMMVQMNEADGLVSGAQLTYADAVRPVLQIIGTAKDATAAGLNVILMDDRFIFVADTTVHLNPSAETLATIASQASRVVEFFGLKPQVAMLSYSNFNGTPGSEHDTPSKMRKAAEILKKRRPDIRVDGDMQADTAINPEIAERIFPFCEIKGGANILVFPNLEASNIAYKLIQQLGRGEVLGPFLLGVKKSANILQRTTTVESIIHSVVLTALEAQHLKEKRKARR